MTLLRPGPSPLFPILIAPFPPSSFAGASLAGRGVPAAGTRGAGVRATGAWPGRRPAPASVRSAPAPVPLGGAAPRGRGAGSRVSCRGASIGAPFLLRSLLLWPPAPWSLLTGASSLGSTRGASGRAALQGRIASSPFRPRVPASLDHDLTLPRGPPLTSGGSGGRGTGLLRPTPPGQGARRSLLAGTSRPPLAPVRRRFAAGVPRRHHARQARGCHRVQGGDRLLATPAAPFPGRRHHAGQARGCDRRWGWRVPWSCGPPDGALFCTPLPLAGWQAGERIDWPSLDGLLREIQLESREPQRPGLDAIEEIQEICYLASPSWPECPAP